MTPRFRFVGGKGGVGKTTLSGALAVTAARTGGEVLVVSTDPAHSLGDAFGLRVGPEPRRHPELPNLSLAEIAGPAAWDRWLGERRSAMARILRDGTLLDDAEVDSLLSLPVPGVDELVGLLEIVRLSEETGADRVVVDTAPTGHTLRLLDAPDSLRRMVALLEAALDRDEAVRRALVGGEPAADPFVADLEREASALSELLRDPAEALVSWVLLPEWLAWLETVDALSALRDRGIEVGELLVNRLAQEPPGSCPACRARRASEQAVLQEIARRSGTRLLGVPEVVGEPIGAQALADLGTTIEEVCLPDPPSTSTPRAPNARDEVPPPPELVRELVPSSIRLVLVAGKGGVGKSTVAAALGLAVARAGRDCLLLSTDPAHSLGDVLEVDLGDREVPIVPRLGARELESGRSLDRWIDAAAPLAERLSGAGLEMDRRIFERLLETVPPGLDELAALEALVAAETEDRLLVVDTAPTGHFLRLLESPEIGLDWLRTLLRAQLSYREILGLGETAEALLEGTRQLKRLRERLRDGESTGVVAVVRPGVLPARESKRLVDALERLSIRTLGVVVNGRVEARACPRCARRRSEQDRWLAASDLPVGSGLVVAAAERRPPPTGVPGLGRWTATWTLGGPVPADSGTGGPRPG